MRIVSENDEYVVYNHASELFRFSGLHKDITYNSILELLNSATNEHIIVWTPKYVSDLQQTKLLSALYGEFQLMSATTQPDDFVTKYILVRREE